MNVSNLHIKNGRHMKSGESENVPYLSNNSSYINDGSTPRF